MIRGLGDRDRDREDGDWGRSMGLAWYREDDSGDQGSVELGNRDGDGGDQGGGWEEHALR